jgi:hypothetical protein
MGAVCFVGHHSVCPFPRCKRSCRSGPLTVGVSSPDTGAGAAHHGLEPSPRDMFSGRETDTPLKSAMVRSLMVTVDPHASESSEQKTLIHPNAR